MSKMGLWVAIPDESWVKVWVENANEEDDDPSFVADGRFHRSIGGDDELEDLHLTPRRRKLRSPVNYTLLVKLSFADDAEAVVFAEVTLPNGEPLPETFSGQHLFRSSVINGSAGSTDVVNLMLVTEAGEGGSL